MPKTGGNELGTNAWEFCRISTPGIPAGRTEKK